MRSNRCRMRMPKVTFPDIHPKRKYIKDVWPFLVRYVSCSSGLKGYVLEGARTNFSQNDSVDDETEKIIKIMPTKELGMKRSSNLRMERWMDLFMLTLRNK